MWALRWGKGLLGGGGVLGAAMSNPASAWSLRSARLFRREPDDGGSGTAGLPSSRPSSTLEPRSSFSDELVMVAESSGEGGDGGSGKGGKGGGGG